MRDKKEQQKLRVAIWQLYKHNNSLRSPDIFSAGQYDQLMSKETPVLMVQKTNITYLDSVPSRTLILYLWHVEFTFHVL